MIVAAPPPARVQVTAQEFRYTLSRQSIRAGWTTVELRNGGQDAHDLRMRRAGGTRVYEWPNVQPGEVADKTFKLLMILTLIALPRVLRPDRHGRKRLRPC